MIRIIAAGFLAIVCLDGFSQRTKVAKPLTLFSVAAEPTTTDEFIYLYKKNHQTKEDYTQQKIDEYLALFINFKLKVKEARLRGIDTTAAFIKEFNSYKEELKKPYLPEGKLIDSLVKVTYKRLQEEVRVSHILISLKTDASPADTFQVFNKTLEIKNRALAGEDFASLAALYSEEPGAQASKGDLGYFTAMQMVYPFENAAYSGKPRDIVGPVRTRFGYHILKIVDRKPARGEVEVSHIMIRTGAERDEAKPKEEPKEIAEPVVPENPKKGFFSFLKRKKKKQKSELTTPAVVQKEESKVESKATSSKNLIFEIHDRLSGGVAWDELCKQYSEDPSSKNNGGKLKPFGVMTMTTVPEFDRVAFSLQNPGDVSDPFQTQYGWHIVRLERKIPLPSFEEMAPSLKGRVARDERVQVSKQALMQKLKMEFLFIENAAVKSKVFASADTSLIKGKWRVAASYPSKEKLFSLETKNVTAQDFLVYVKQNQKISSQTPDKYIEQLYNTFVEKLISDVLEVQIRKNHPEFEMLLKEYFEGILLFDIMEKEVWKKASEDSVGQRKYFDSHQDKYVAGERGVTVMYSSGTASIISTLKGCIEKNDSLGIQKIIQSKNARQEAGVFQKEERPALSKIDWKPGLYSVENNRMYYLVHLKEIVPPGPLSFEEARSSVISDYQDNLEKEWLEGLRKKYPVKVNDKAKKNVVEKLMH